MTIPGHSLPPILGFRGEYEFLSNFHPASIRVAELEFPTVEHAFQSAKSLDAVWAERIRTAPSPADAKRMGRQAPLRPDWAYVKDDVMLAMVRRKFTAHAHLAQALLATGTRRLVEANDWGDTYWGVVRSSGGEYGTPGEFVGENRLGAILMRVRSELLWMVEPDRVTIVG